MSRFTFEYDLFSDLYKDAHGFRPRYHAFYDESTTDEERQAIWDQTIVELNESMEQEAAQKEQDLVEFKTLVANTIELGAGNEETALRWLVQDEEFYSGQCVEHWVWDKGILFTDYGRQLVERLLDIVKFKEMEYA